MGRRSKAAPFAVALKGRPWMGRSVMPEDCMQTSDTERLGDFELHRELGRGGMGIVHEAPQMLVEWSATLRVMATAIAAIAVE